jgi:hypothetical protein
MHVPNPVFRHRSLKRGFREVRHASRRGDGPHVDEQRHPVVAQQLDELVERPRRVSDCEDYFARWDGSIAGTTTCLTIVLPLSWNDPDSRNAGS